MALTPDQTAILQLLLERGQSYPDLARVLGVEEAEVRERARAALTELGGADPDREVELTDYLLGQADPIGRADAVRHLRDNPEDHRLAGELTETLRAMYPNADLPRLPGEPRAPRRPRPAAEGESRSRVALSASQTRMIVGLGAGAVLLVAVVLAITGVFGGGDEEAPEAADSTDTTAQTTPTEGEQIERVVLRAKGGGNASGEASFGITTNDQPYVEVSIEGLDPAPQGQTYVIWLMLNDKDGYPLSPITVNPQGGFQDTFSIPSAVLQIVERVQKIDVSIAAVREIQDAVRNAIDETALVLEKPGETVLEGTVPTAAAAAEGSGEEESG